MRMLEPGDVVADKYQVKALIGRGGMGEVYLVRHALTERRFALKVLAPALVGTAAANQRLVREALAAGRIEHRNVVDVFDVGEHRGAVYLVMEYLSGQPLSELLETGELSDRALLSLFLRALDGVAAAHDLGIVHRDLKPENIFVTMGSDRRIEEPRVMDFGISQLPDRLGERETTGNFVVGTPHFMCVEQLEGARDLDARVDVYALGVSLYRAFSGVVPFQGQHFAELAERVVNATPTPLSVLRPDLPGLLCQTVMRAMARRREDRHPSVRVLARDLEPFVTGLDDVPRLRRPRPAPTLPATSAPAALPAVSLPPVPAARTAGRWWLLVAAIPVGAVAAWWFTRAATPVASVAPWATTTPAAALPALPPARPAALAPAIIDDPLPVPSPVAARPRRARGRVAVPVVEVAPSATAPAAPPAPQPGERMTADSPGVHPLPRRLDEADPYAQ